MLSSQSEAKRRLWNLAFGPARLTLPRGKRRLLQKRYLRAERSERKMKALDRIPFLGVWIDRRTVRSHEYLAVHHLPHSTRVAKAIVRPVTRPALPLLVFLSSLGAIA